MILEVLAVVVLLFNAQIVISVRSMVRRVFVAGECIVQPLFGRARQQQGKAQHQRAKRAEQVKKTTGLHSDILRKTIGPGRDAQGV